MRVLVDIGAERNYTYEAPEGTKAGDTVTVPGPPWNRRSAQTGTVIALESDYDGPVRKVLGEWPDDRRWVAVHAALARLGVEQEARPRIGDGRVAGPVLGLDGWEKLLALAEAGDKPPY